jgi:hypothetical protein
VFQVVLDGLSPPNTGSIGHDAGLHGQRARTPLSTPNAVQRRRGLPSPTDVTAQAATCGDRFRVASGPGGHERFGDETITGRRQVEDRSAARF